MIKIALTGNIASGKSEVENILSSFDCVVYDLDKITHNLYEDKETKEEILKQFQTTDRKEIAKIVFQDKEKLRNLEAIIHPKLKDFILNIKEDFSFVSGALIFETGFNKYFDKTIFVEADYDTRLERLIKRNNLSKKEAKIRLDSQNSKFKNSADFIIMNNSDKEELKIQVKNLLQKIKKEYFIL